MKTKLTTFLTSLLAASLLFTTPASAQTTAEREVLTQSERDALFNFALEDLAANEAFFRPATHYRSRSADANTLISRSDYNALTDDAERAMHDPIYQRRTFVGYQDAAGESLTESEYQDIAGLISRSLFKAESDRTPEELAAIMRGAEVVTEMQNLVVNHDLHRSLLNFYINDLLSQSNTCAVGVSSFTDCAGTFAFAMTQLNTEQLTRFPVGRGGFSSNPARRQQFITADPDNPTTYQLQDASRSYQFATDASGDPVYRMDENMMPILDDDGEPIRELVYAKLATDSNNMPIYAQQPVYDAMGMPMLTDPSDPTSPVMMEDIMVEDPRNPGQMIRIQLHEAASGPDDPDVIMVEVDADGDGVADVDDMNNPIMAPLPLLVENTGAEADGISLLLNYLNNRFNEAPRVVTGGGGGGSGSGSIGNDNAWLPALVGVSAIAWGVNYYIAKTKFANRLYAYALPTRDQEFVTGFNLKATDNVNIGFSVKERTYLDRPQEPYYNFRLEYSF